MSEIKKNPTSLTPLETRILKDGLFGNPYYHESGWAWTGSIAEYAKVNPSAFRGAFTDLKVKGMVETDGNTGRDACARPTKAAAEIMGLSLSVRHGEEI